MVKVKIERLGEPGPLKLNAEIGLPSKAKVYLMNATSEANCDILSDLRDIVQNQVSMLKRVTRDDAMNNQQAELLLKLTKVYQMMDSSTEKEHAKYDYSGESVESLKKLAAGES